MKNMRKLLCVFLTIVMMVSIAAVSAFADDTVTLKFSSWGDANEKNLIEGILAKFTADTGINVEYVYVPEDYNTKLTTMAASGELPDCGYMSEPSCVQWANEGMLEDLTPVFEKDGCEAKIDTNKFIDKNGKMVGVSLSNEVVIMYYNKDAFDAAGIEYPPYESSKAWTWDEFVDVARKLTVDRSGKHPNEEGFDPENVQTYGCKLGTAQFVMEAIMRSNGGGVYSEDGKSITLDSPESIEALQKMSDLINVEHVAPPVGSAITQMNMSSAFVSNSIAMVMDGQWSLQSMNEAREEDDVNFGIGVLPYMKKPNTTNTGTPIVIFKGTKHLEEAQLLASYMMNTDFIMDAIDSGLWMPTSLDWYTEEDKIARWTQSDAHPEHYKEAVIDYTLDCVTPNSYFNLGCVQQIEDIYSPALDPGFINNVPMKDCVDTVIEQVRKTFDQYQASLTK